MAALPSPTQVAGTHSAIYEAYYAQVDPNGTGCIGAMEAARFLKKSGLSDVVLSRVWDLSDPGGRGSLDKAGFFVALKLVAVCQSGRDLSMANVHLTDLPPPKMGDKLPPVTRPPPPRSGTATPRSGAATPTPQPAPPVIQQLNNPQHDWTIQPNEREKYDKLFDSLQPSNNGLIPGNRVKGVLMESKLPLDTLGKIWDLADMDKDGALDRFEFTVAMHLVYKALEKHAIPNELPPELLRQKSSIVNNQSAPKILDGPIVPPPVVPIVPQIPPMPQVPVVPPQPIQQQMVPGWVVTPEDKSRFDHMFTAADADKDGFVSGVEIKDVFLKSGVPQNILAHIWGLCDLRQSGKLNSEQFALAMWLVERCLKGIEPPVTLQPDMVPPSFRNSRPGDANTHVENNNMPYTNPELEMISKDIEELVREKLQLQAEVQQKEADVKIKTGEIKSLQSELDTLAATKKQLENQKGEAQKRLNDLRLQVDKLRNQADEQAEVLKEQEGELTSKKEQLENLRKEEEKLEKQKDDNDKQLDKLTSKLQDTQLQISQAKAKITQLQEQQRQMNDAIDSCDNAITTGDALHVPDTALRISPDFRSPEYQMTNGNTSPDKTNGGFIENGNHDPFNDINNATNNGFSDDPFKNDPFKNEDAFNSNDPFAAAFTQPIQSDPFNEFGTQNNNAKGDPFDPFGDGKQATDKTQADVDKDAFGCDPFAILHAPTREGGATSPSPALPPKKSKQPPPRPAPPRPQPPRPAQPTGFANFADFDSKCCHRSWLSMPHSPEPTYASSSVPYVLFSKTSQSQSNTSNLDLNKNQSMDINKNQSSNTTMDFTDDPFRDYRYEDPFNIVDPFADDNTDSKTTNLANLSTSNFDPFGMSTLSVTNESVRSKSTEPWEKITSNVGGRASVPLNLNSNSWSLNLNANEDKQLAWAAQESLRLQQVEKQRMIQEQKDLELAIALSKQETSGR